MIKFYAVLSALLLFVYNPISGQDFSNKGTDFWVGYGYHCRMTTANGNTQDMVLYFATESVTDITVSIPGLGYSQTYTNIAANTIFSTGPLPKNGPQDARLINETISNKGIHIVATKPIVAYSHIYNNNVSGATLLFPTNTLGREYYSINFEQRSNEPSSNSFFYAIATDTGTTTIEVIPSVSTQTMVAGQVYTYTLTQGQVFNALGTVNGNNGLDLTGSRIRSISTGAGGCKRIAVFSGSGKINIVCPLGASSASADNYMVQAFPKNAWGKNYLTVPTSQLPNNYFRIAVQDPTTVVKMNGTTLTGLINGFYYQIPATDQPNMIEADKPIMVAQYITSANVCGNTAIGGNGDPEVIYLSPVEQNIDRVIINSTSNFAINRHYVNVVLPNGGTAISSFRIDGAPPTGTFVPHPRNSKYSYLVQSLNAGQHTLVSDSGFNAIAYGYGSAESYGYNAGANVKDLYQFVSLQNPFATVNTSTTCNNTPFNLSMTFPYQPTKIRWVFGPALNAMGLADVSINSPAFDSTWQVNDRQLFRYRLPNMFTIATPGTYTIKIYAENPTPDGCNGEQEISYDLQVLERPKANFSFTTSGCVSDSVRFTDNSNTYGRTAVRWFWDFRDGQTSAVRNPAHLYNTAGSYNVKFATITDVGCVSDTIEKTVALTEPPVAKFGISLPGCAGKTISFTDSSTTANAPIVKWTWTFGDGSAPVVATINAPQGHTYANAGQYTVTLQVENSVGCKSIVSQRQVTITLNPVAGFNFAKACLPNGAVQFTDASTIGDGTQHAFTYAWKFGDGATSTLKNPSHSYTTVGPFSAVLTVTSGAGCVDSITKQIDSVFAQPQARFTAPAEVCLGASISLTDQSTAPNSTVTEWLWNFGDGNTSTQQNPSHTYTSAGTYTITLVAKSAVGCSSAPEPKTIVINALPVAEFQLPAPACVTNTVSFTDLSIANAGNITKWTWNFGDGSAPSSQQSPTHTYVSTGAYDVTLQVETNKGCVSTIRTKRLTINPLPKPGFIMPGNCVNDPVSQFTDTSSIADGSQSQFTYLWNFGDANANAGNPNTSTVKDASHRFIATGNYNIKLIVTSNNGCRDSITQVFTINGAVPTQSFAFPNGTQRCSNDSVLVVDNSSVLPGKLVKLEIYWDYTNDPTNKVVVNNPIQGTTYRHKYPEFFTPATKTYRVKLVSYSGLNCLTEKDTTITLLATPEINFPAITPVCADAPQLQIVANATNMTTGSGVFSGNGVSSTGVFSPGTGAGTYPIQFSYTGTNGCINRKDQSLTIYPVPTVNAGPDRFVLEGGSAVLIATASGNGLSYLWTPTTGLNNPTVLQPTSTPKDDVNYQVLVTSADGCTASDQVFVKLLKTPTIPNVFTPNNDGINDRWEIKYLESYPGATIEVFNRYGSLVYRSIGYPKPWDGTYNGKEMPAGTYYYIINPKNGRKQISGFVDIVR